MVSTSSRRSGIALAGLRLWQRVNEGEAWRTLLTATGLLAVFVAFLSAVQFATPGLAGNDGYYHIKLAYLMRTRGLVPAFDWLPLTVLNPSEFVDHHFLFHVLLIPFTFGDLRVGAKLASVVLPAFTFLGVWWLLRGQRVPYAGLWATALLVISEAFIYRMSMPRTQSLSLAVLVLGLHWLLGERYRRLLPLAFGYVWLYDGFPLILLMAGFYVAAAWLVERRWPWQALAYPAIGIGLGLLVNPYFPDNLLFIYRHVGPKLFNPTAIQVGSEWYPYDTTQLIENSGVALAAFLSGVVALGLHSGRMKTATAASLLVSILFGAMLFQSRRFVEYWPAFALVFAALAWNPVIAGWLARRSQAGAPGSSPAPHGLLRRWGTGEVARTWLLGAVMVVVLLPGLVRNLGAARTSLQDSSPYERYAGAAAWLENNTPAGARVFQTDWDDFPRLFYYNTHNVYTLGLDPTYMQLYDAELYETWVDVSKGRVDRPSAVIWQQFGAAYVFTDLRHEAFLSEAQDDPDLEEVYRDDYAVVFQLTNQTE